VVDVYVNYLRKKLGAGSLNSDVGYCVIETVRGEGYQMGGLKRMMARTVEYPTSAACAGA
jgi:DNA-binding winged helix-turn-helix (wHTH) protein